MIAEFETSQWVQNLRAYPQVQLRVGKQSFAATARVLDLGENPISTNLSRIREIQGLSQTKYGWGNGTVVELVPQR